MRSLYTAAIGFVVSLLIFGLFAYANQGVNKIDNVTNRYMQIINYSLDMKDSKYWGYLRSNPTILNNNEVLEINLYNIIESPDVTEIRLYNICSSVSQIGKIYVTVNGKPALPTIGHTANPIPVYMATPPCPQYGTTNAFIFDTNDTRGDGHFKYDFLYEGKEPLTIKSLELYVTNYQ